MINDYRQIREYKLGSLRPQIFLFNREKTTMHYKVDSPDGYMDDTIVQGIASTDSWLLRADSVKYNVSTIEENRYLFQSTLEVVISEHLNISNILILKEILRKGWIVGIEDKMGGSYVINPEFNAQITYKYEINDSSNINSLVITFTFNQNMPCLLFNGVFNPLNKFGEDLCEYGIGAVKTFKMAASIDIGVEIDGNEFLVYDYEYGIATIEYNKGSFVYTDEYDGDRFTQTIQFSIPWEQHQYKLHHNLIEFIYNKYVAIITTTNENNAVVGFPDALIPEYTITTSENNAPNVINITLRAVSSSFPVLMTDKLEVVEADRKKYITVESECVDDVYASTVIAELNDDGSLSGDYYALEGYTDKKYNIVGTYSSIYDTRFGIRLYNPEISCVSNPCYLYMPSFIYFSMIGEQYEIETYTECTISASYDLENCSVLIDENNMITITNKVEKNYEIIIKDSSGAEYPILCQFDSGSSVVTNRYPVTAQEQELDITTHFSIKNVSSIDSPIEVYPNRYNTGYVYSIPENKSTSPRDIEIKITYVTGQIEYVIIAQDQLYEKIQYNGDEECIDNDLWEMAHRFIGYYPDQINIDDGYIPVRVIEYAAQTCYADKGYRQEKATEICMGGYIYDVIDYYNSNMEYQFSKLVATDTECGSGSQEKWEINYDLIECFEGTGYYLEEKYVSSDGSIWYKTDIVRRSGVVAQDYSCDGSSSGSSIPQYRWYDAGETFCLPDDQSFNCSKTGDTEVTMCENGDLYSLKAEYIDTECSGEYAFIGYIKGDLIESDSSQCGGGSGSGTETEEKYEKTVCGSELGTGYETMKAYEVWGIYQNGELIRYEYRNPVYSDACDTSEVLSYKFTGDTTKIKVNGTQQSFTTGSPISVTLYELGYEKITGASDMFTYSNITELTEMPSLASCTTMQAMFYGCSGLTSLDASNWNTSNVTTMEGIFMNCPNLKSLNTSGWDTSKVKGMASMFRNCGLTSLDLSHFNTSAVSSIFSCFADSTSLTSLDLSNWDISNAKLYSGMFTGCSGLTSITLNNVNDVTRTRILEQLSSAGLSSQVTVYPSSSGDTESGGTETPDTGGTETPDTGVTTDDTLSFEFTGSSLSYKMNGTTTYTATTSPYAATLSDMALLTFTSAKDMFSGCTGLTKVTHIPSTSTVTNMSYMFNGCTALTSVDLSNVTTTAVTDMGNMFYGCKSLTSLDVSNFKVSKVTNMTGMFYNCSGLTSLDLTSWFTAKVNNFHSMFYGCKSLTSMTLTNFSISGSMLGMFRGCSGLRTLSLPANATPTNLNYAFHSCSSLVSLDLSGWDVSTLGGMNTIFSGCTSLVSLDISGWELPSTAANWVTNFFNGCGSLTSVTMRNCSSTTISVIENALTDAGIKDKVLLEK